MKAAAKMGAASQSAPLAECFDRLAALPEYAEWPEYAAIGREAVAAHPDEVTAHEFLIAILQAAPHGAPYDEIAEAMRAATLRGLPGFFESLVRNLPDETTDEEIEKAKEHPDLSLRLVAAAQLAGRGRPQEGLAIFQSILRRALELGEAKPPTYFTLQLLLALHASGDLDRARAAGASYRHYLEQAGRDDAPQGFLATTWVLIQELEVLPSHFPQSLRQALVRGLKKGDLEEASTEAEVYVHTEGSRRARTHLRDLTETPNIANILRLEVREAFRRSPPGKGFPIFLSVLIVAFLLAKFGADHRSEPDWADLEKPTPRIHEESTVRLFEEARSDLISVCRAVPHSSLCDNGKAARRALFEGRCDDALALLNNGMLSFDGEDEYLRWAKRGFSTLRKLHQKLCANLSFAVTRSGMVRQPERSRIALPLWSRSSWHSRLLRGHGSPVPLRGVDGKQTIDVCPKAVIVAVQHAPVTVPA